MTAHAIWLPFPPSVNNLFSQGMVKGRMRRFPSRKYKSWRKAAWVYIKSTRPPTFDGPVAVRITLTPPSSARRDVDNYSKAILDALVETRVLRDDSQVQALLSVWKHDASKPGALVEVGPTKAERPALTPCEREELQDLKRDGCALISPNRPVSALIKSLIQKGYVKEIPGLIEGVPQGYCVAD